MLIKPLCSLFLFAICFQSVMAGETRSSASSVAALKKPALSQSPTEPDMPVITNEAEYAAWIKTREKARRTSSVASSEAVFKASKNASSSSTKSVR